MNNKYYLEKILPKLPEEIFESPAILGEILIGWSYHYVTDLFKP